MCWVCSKLSVYLLQSPHHKIITSILLCIFSDPGTVPAHTYSVYTSDPDTVPAHLQCIFSDPGRVPAHTYSVYLVTLTQSQHTPTVFIEWPWHSPSTPTVFIEWPWHSPSTHLQCIFSNPGTVPAHSYSVYTSDPDTVPAHLQCLFSNPDTVPAHTYSVYLVTLAQSQHTPTVCN